MDELSPHEVDALTKVMGNMVLSEYKQKESKEPPPQPSESSFSKDMFFTQENAQISASGAQFLQLQENPNDQSMLSPSELENLENIKLDVEVSLGNATLPLSEVLQLRPGSVVALDKLAGEPVDLIANGKVIAHAEVVVVNNNFGIKLLEIVNRTP
jgi:flagellar motor switch protein FliN/FliY